MPAKASRIALVVDDERSVRRIAGRMMLSLGYEAIECADGEAALDSLRETRDRLSVVLLDVTMPGIGGMETLARLRAAGVRVPVVIMSGYEVGLDDHAEEEGPIAVLQKPFSFDDLALTLSQFVS
jgi:FixJ family two-component response regulator